MSMTLDELLKQDRGMADVGEAKMKILIACEFSGVVREAFKASRKPCSPKIALDTFPTPGTTVIMICSKDNQTLRPDRGISGGSLAAYHPCPALTFEGSQNW